MPPRGILGTHLRLPLILLLSLILLVLSGLPGARTEARPTQAEGAYTLADTWPVPEDRRPANAWARVTGVEALPDGRLLVADADPALPRVSLLAPDGSPSAVLVEGEPNCDPARAADDVLCSPVHIAADSARNRLYVTDRLRDALLVYQLDGQWLRTHSGIEGPHGVAVAPNGVAHVTASRSGRIHRFDPDGAVLQAWDAVAFKPGANLLSGIDIDAEFDIYVIDARQSEILKLNAVGQRASVHGNFAGSARLLDLAVQPVPGSGSRRAIWLATNLGLLYTETLTGLSDINPVGSLTAVASGPGADLYAAWVDTSQTISELLRFDRATARTADPLRIGALPVPAGLLRGPDRIAVGADGKAYALDRTPRVQRFDVTTGQAEDQWLAEDLIAIDAATSGRLFGVDSQSIHVLDPPSSGLRLLERSRWSAGSGAFLSEIAWAAPDRLAALDIGRRQLRRFDAGSGAESAPIQLGDPMEASHWSDLAVDSGGAAWILDRQSGNLARIANDGSRQDIELERPARRLTLRGDDEPVLLDAAGRVWHFAADGSLRGTFDATRREVDPASRPYDLAALADDSLLIVDRAAGIVSRYDWDPEAHPERPEQGQECVYSHDKLAEPSSISLGQTVEIRLLASGECSRRRLPPLDLMLVIDASGSMAGERIELVRQAALDFIRALDLTESRVAMVSYSQSAELVSGFADDEARLWRALEEIRPFGASRMDLGLSAAHAAWQNDRRQGVDTVFIILGDGRSDRDLAMTEGDRIKAAGVELFTVGTSTGQAERDLMRDLASSPDHSFVAEEPSFLFEVLDAIARRIAATLLFGEARVVDRLPVNMRYVADSARPPAAYDPDARTLTWQLQDVPFSGFDLRFEVEPLAAGDWPTNEEASAEVTDGFGEQGAWTFPVPRVLVVPPTSTPTATATATATATPTPDRLYLPLALFEICEPTIRQADVVLVLDTSSSMAGSKLEAAKDAALTFLDLIEFSHERVAIVTFDGEARLVRSLSNRRSDLEAAIRGLVHGSGTRIDAGLELARDELLANRRQGATAAVVLLTDGQQPEGRSRILALGRQLCVDDEVELYAIGLGEAETVGYDLLQEIACQPDMAFLAPQGDDLAVIYELVAGDIPCPRDAFWGGR